jgi:hypothetical protein
MDISSDNNFDTYTGAGCIFTNNTLILAGYQPYKKIPYISGIGGEKQKDETYIITVIRELIEELFDIKDLSSNIFNELSYKFPKPIHIQYTNRYVNCIFTFDQLIQILDILSSLHINSKLYPIFPKNVSELLFCRTIREGEISHLCLLPVIPDLTIDEEFNNDIIKLYREILKLRTPQGGS